MNKINFLFLFYISVVVSYAQTLPYCLNVPSPNLTSIVGSQPLSIASADFNGDGKVDLATANSGSNNVSILLATGIGTGSFAPAVNYTLGVNSNPNSLIAADFNSDGKMDLAATNPTLNKVSILLGSGTGSFIFTSTYMVGSGPASIVAGDFNADGKIDLVTANRYSYNISILLGIGTGSFSPAVNYLANNTPLDLCIGDFNGDSKMDIAAVNNSSDDVSILLGSGTGTFMASTNYNVGNDPTDIISDDFNSDGKTDLVILNNAFLSSGPYSFSILLGSGTGSFGAAVNYTLSFSPSALSVGDFNGDGKSDVSVSLGGSTSGTRYISTFIGTGLGTFAGPINFNLNYLPGDICKGDFNNDGKLDLSVIDGTSLISLSILLGMGNGDFSKIDNYSTGLGPNSITSADFDGDGIFDLATANRLSGNVSILKGLGNSTFLAATNYSVGYHPYSIACEDFNNDGNPDLAVANEGSANISILKGSTTGTFAAAVNYSVGNYPTNIATADFNNDGNIDIAVTNPSMSSSPNVVTILIGTGIGTFSPGVNCNITFPPFSIAVGDLDNDSNVDLIVANINSNDISTFLGSPTGTFAPGSDFYGISRPSSLTTKDLNGDNMIDLIVTNRITDSVSILLGSGTGNFTGFADYKVGTNPYDVGIGDFNNDGKADLAVVNSGTASTVSMLFGNGNGTFNPAINYNAGSSSISILVNDLNGDGTDDIAMANAGSNGVSTMVNGIPLLSVTGTSNLCIGTSATLVAYGASTYSWNTGALLGSIIVLPTTNTTYTVSGINSIGCINTKTISIAVDSTCQDVWPGDANSDGTADNLDVLELGLHYTQIGVPRAITSINWQSYFANNWTGAITNGKNLNHSDCNGDGTINDNDTLAIYNNYGLTHAFKPAQTTTVNPQISIVPDQSSVIKGAWGTASIYLGNATNNINNINGVAFAVDFDNTLIETNSIYIEYQNSFLDAGQNLDFRKLDFTNGKIYTATTHTLNNNVSGNGLIGILHYKILSSLTTDQLLNIGIFQANQSNASGTISPLTSGTGTLMAIGASVGLQELNGNVISMSPNPTSGSITIHSKTELQKIEVLSITGQVILTEIPASTSHTLSLQSFTNGIYFVNLYQNDRIVKREKIVLNK